MTTRIFVVLVGVWALQAIPALAQDPVKVDPAHHKVELENADVRVLRITFGAGEKAPLHDHPSSVAVFMSDARMRVSPVGAAANEDPRKTGEVVPLAAGKHTVENLGKQPVEIVLVELKKPGAATYKNMALDPVKVGGNRYAVVAENADVRVLRTKAVVGQPGVEHEHPSNVVVRISGGENQKPGTVTWAQGPQKHGAATPAKVAGEVVIVELKSGAGAKPAS